MITQKSLHPRDKIDRLYVTRKDGGRRLAKIENCVYGTIKGLVKYINKSKETFTTVTSNSNNNRQKVLNQK